MTDDLHVNNSYNRETLWHARRTTRKLKTYQTSLCFYDLAIAAPSMKAALEVWGAGSNLFHQGVAKESSDPEVIAATMLKPGVVLRRPVGSDEVVLKVNGKEVASGVVPVSAPLIFTANDCLDFGIDLGSPVGIEYYDQAPFKFNGKIEGARVEYLGSPAEVQEEKLQTDGPIPAED